MFPHSLSLSPAVALWWPRSWARCMGKQLRPEGGGQLT